MAIENVVTGLARVGVDEGVGAIVGLQSERRDARLLDHETINRADQMLESFGRARVMNRRQLQIVARQNARAARRDFGKNQRAIGGVHLRGFVEQDQIEPGFADIAQVCGFERGQVVNLVRDGADQNNRRSAIDLPAIEGIAQCQRIGRRRAFVEQECYGAKKRPAPATATEIG